jgi:hypothetical protein
MSKVNNWMQRLLLIPVFVLVAFAIELAIWAVDRAPPFEILSVDPAMAAPGQQVQLTARVRRDVDRYCSVTYTRHIYDGANFRHDLEGAQRMNVEAIRAMDARAPGMLHVALRVPADAVPGSAALVTTLDYECNPLHAAWPIHVVSEMQFTILEPP